MEVNSHTWKLSDPGMDLLERAGLAGLHMALAAATEAGRDLSPLTWTDADLTADSVTVRWTGPPQPAFEKLIEWAWQVRDSVLYFPAVHDHVDAANWHLRVPVHNGIMRTFLQHPNVQPKLEAVTRVVQLEEDKRITVSFESPAERVDDLDRPVNDKTNRPHKKKVASRSVKPHDDVSGLFTARSQFKRPTVALSNWVYPGIAGRYGGEKSWEGAAERAILLMLAPTVCLYQRLQGEGNNWVIVVPDVRDLEAFADARRHLHVAPEFIDVASLGDAGLRFVAEFGSQPARRELQAGCRVLAMGYVGYYQGQSIRKSVLDVSPHPIPVRRYRRLHAAFPNHFVPRKAAPAATAALPAKGRGKPKPTAQPVAAPQGNGWYKLPTGRGRIADNLVNGRPWYRDLFVPLVWDEDEVKRLRDRNPGTSAERIWFAALSYQRSSLMTLVDEPDMWDDLRDRLFVEAFWGVLRSLYRKEAKAVAERGGSRTVKDRWKHLIDDVRRKLMEAKTQRTSRAALAELFAAAGTQPGLANRAGTVWRLMDHVDHWEKGRDLALLAMVSYRSKPRKSDGLPPSNTSTHGA